MFAQQLLLLPQLQLLLPPQHRLLHRLLPQLLLLLLPHLEYETTVITIEYLKTERNNPFKYYHNNFHVCVLLKLFFKLKFAQ